MAVCQRAGGTSRATFAAALLARRPISVFAVSEPSSCSDERSVGFSTQLSHVFLISATAATGQLEPSLWMVQVGFLGTFFFFVPGFKMTYEVTCGECYFSPGALMF